MIKMNPNYFLIRIKLATFHQIYSLIYYRYFELYTKQEEFYGYEKNHLDYSSSKIYLVGTMLEIILSNKVNLLQHSNF